ncbi:Uu.00g147040.m01.CDS01 [Anthostomella pinea]|uniref:Uu.00g147040.m01.CDS01 n=1 Tax=Anthostomella pinea TaxID=933095 RepID=A0AAI8YLW4_9PEZI|nr:Uu.00g147040.m01.CDS01 [Anthostomella pinea]
MVKTLFGISVVRLLALSSSLLALISWASSLTLQDDRAAAWPYGPFLVSGTEMKNSQGDSIVYAGTNWDGHGEVMIPDGLQYQSVESVVSMIKSLGMNAIRLTYPIQLVDQIYDNGGKDTTVQSSFIQALGQTNGTKVYSQFLAKNPSFNTNTTRLQVFDAVAAERHSWFGDSDYNVANWVRGLTYMANHGKSWTALTSISLRNELRSPDNNATLKSESYNWRDWYTFIKQGSSAINAANSDILIFLSGLDFDTWITPMVQGTAMTPGTATYSAVDFPGYANKLVLEIHNYNNDATNCSSLQSTLYHDGFQAMHPEDSEAVNVLPVLLTEFGFEQTSTEWQRTYATCIANYLSQQKAGWFIWVISGSYYIRSGTQDYDETWGLLTHDWSAWRSQSYIDGGLKPLVENTAKG